MTQYADRDAFDVALRSNLTSREIARRFGINPTSVARIRKKHFKGADANGRSTTDQDK